jgi:putative pre-16S rRNA nuclease
VKRRVLAVDFGDRRTGLAATDPTGTIVVPLDAILRTSDAQCAQAIAELARERDSEVIVVGMPLDAEGNEGARARRTHEFIAALAKVAPCAVEGVDESHSTDRAHELLREGGLKAARRKKLADSVAAIVILERFLGRSR